VRCLPPCCVERTKKNAEDPLHSLDSGRDMEPQTPLTDKSELRSAVGNGKRPSSFRGRPLKRVTWGGADACDIKVSKVKEAAEKLLPGQHMSDWQRAWCTSEVVGIYLHGRNGNISRAAEILAIALQWRAKHQAVLTGAVVPRWQGDFRVVTRSVGGQPILYTCVKTWPLSHHSADFIDHVAAVLESAITSMVQSATTFFCVIDYHGFRHTSNVDLRPVVALAEMMKQPYRDRLHTVFAVDAPLEFTELWSVLPRVLSGTTKRKIRFAKFEEMHACLTEVAGIPAADKMRNLMELNRADQTDIPEVNLPSELNMESLQMRNATNGTAQPETHNRNVFDVMEVFAPAAAQRLPDCQSTGLAKNVEELFYSPRLAQFRDIDDKYRFHDSNDLFGLSMASRASTS